MDGPFSGSRDVANTEAAYSLMRVSKLFIIFRTLSRESIITMLSQFTHLANCIDCGDRWLNKLRTSMVYEGQ